MQHLKAYVKYLGLGRWRISISELGLSAEGRGPSNALCRKIMERYPEYGEYSLLVFASSGKHQMTIRNISEWAKKMLIDSDKGGIMIKRYKPGPSERS